MGYIVANVIKSPRLCNDSSGTDPRLNRGDGKEVHFNSDDTAGKDPNDDATNRIFSIPYTDSDNKNIKEFTSNSNNLLQKLHPVKGVIKPPDNLRVIEDRLTSAKDAPLEQPVYYKAIDPKYIIISGLSLPKPIKNITKVNKSDDIINIDRKKANTTPLDYSNITKTMNILNEDEANDTEMKEVVKNNANTDVSNIRELREHLLDHLLDYFLNIIKEENYIRNDTRKRNDKDRMKVEDKLRNYYDPHHLDNIFEDEDYYDTNLDASEYHGDDEISEDNLPDNVNQNITVNNESITDIPLDKTDENTATADYRATSIEDLRKDVMSLEQNFKKSNNKSININVPEPVTYKYVILNEKENDFNKTLFNTSEKSEDVTDVNFNDITTTERSIFNGDLNEKVAEVDKDLLHYSDEAVAHSIVYDNDALTVEEYTSFEDYIDPDDEIEVVKKVHEIDINPIVSIKENGRRKLAHEKYINGTLNETYNNTNNPQTFASKMKDKPNNFAIQDLPNSNTIDNTPSNKDNMGENNNKKSSKISKDDIKRKLKFDKNFGSKIHKKSKRHNCRKTITFNLNINLN